MTIARKEGNTFTIRSQQGSTQPGAGAGQVDAVVDVIGWIERRSEVNGVVTDREGNPVPGVRVFQTRMPVTTQETPGATTDSTGRYRLLPRFGT